MRKVSLLMTMFVSAVFLLPAQDDAPSSTDLVIPPVIIEFEEDAGEDMDLFVPDYESIELPDLDVSLPDPGEIPVEGFEFDLPFPEFAEYDYSAGSAFYSEGFLGMGSRNHITGNISLFRMGEGPRFTLSFAHDGMDGFGENSAGEGFSAREETFEGNFVNEFEDFRLTGSGSYLERENGFQQLTPSYGSVVTRSGSGRLDIAGGDALSWNAGLAYSVSEMVLSGDDPWPTDERVLGARAAGEWKKNWFSLGISGSYSFLSESTQDLSRNIIEPDLTLGFEFASFDLSLSGDLFWIPGDILYYPFDISIAGAAGDSFQYRSSGGYRTDSYLNREAWFSYPYVEPSAGIDRGWFWEGSLTLAPSEGLEFGTEWNYLDMESRLMVDPEDFDSSTGLFAVSDVPGKYLDTEVFARWKPGSSWDIDFSWKSQLLDEKDPLKPEQALTAEVVWSGISLSMFSGVSYSIIPNETFPEVSAGVDYNISDGVIISLEGEDLLGFMQGDRYSLGDYIEKGWRLTLLTKISL